MKKALAAAVALAISLGTFACSSGDVSSKMNFYHGQKIPDQFFSVKNWTPAEVTFEIKVDFKVIHMYHILLDEIGKPVSEGFFSTTKIGTSYTVIMKAKPGLSFEAAKKYRLCIGAESPEKIFITTNSYPCMADYDFILENK